MSGRRIHRFSIFCFSWLFSFSLFGQCPQRDSLWQRLITLRDFPERAPSVPEQLKELLKYEAGIQHCTYRRDSTHSLLLQRIAVLYSRQADYVNAILYLKQSVNIIVSNKNDPSVSLMHLVRSYYVLSVFYGELNRPVEKMEAIDNCISIGMKVKLIDRYFLNAMWTKIEYLYDIGDYRNSYETSATAESIINQYVHGTDSVEYITNFRSLKVKTLLAIRDYSGARKILENKIDESIKIGAVQNLGTLYEQMAEVFVQNDEPDKSEKYFRKAFNYDYKADYKYGCSQTLNNLAYTLYFSKYKDFKRAIATYKEAIKLSKESDPAGSSNRFELLNIYGNMASLFVQMKSYDSAARYFQYAFDQIHPGTNEYSILKTSAIDTIQYKRVRYLLLMMTAKADACIKRYKEGKEEKYLSEAIRIYNLADMLLKKIRVNQLEMQSKLFWRNDSRHIYENAIEACYLSNDIENGFNFFEKSHAIVLNEQLSSERWLKEEDILKKAQIKKNILLKEREYNAADRLSVGNADLQTEIFGLKRELALLEAGMKDRIPRYYQDLADTSIINIQEARQKILHNREALIEMFAGDSAVYIMILTAEKTNFICINKIRFDSLSRMLLSFISDPVLINKRYDAFVNTSRQLYQLIFQGIDLPKGRIIISPDGPYFPFETLITSKSGEPVNYFLNDHAVSYTYSARFLLNDFYANSTTSGKSFIGIAPVSYPSAFSLASLGGSDKSLNRISGHFTGAANFVLSSATRNSFMRQFYQYKIIQLYTHASDNSSNNEPVIYFADSALYLSDLIGERKPLTRLIVLSACETGTGREYKGEGVFSFNRGFAALGIPSSVTNLWAVDNESTYKITELFYKHVAEGLALDEALQNAKIEFINTASKEKQLPCFWAAAVVVGNTESIQIARGISWAYFAGVVGAPVLFFTIFIALRKRKKRDYIRIRTRVGTTS